jgi:hypothetical protein
MRAGVDFQHVLMTRFNLATPGRESDLRNRPGWLTRRFELFERYCLPSVAAQTLKNFRWVIYFDEHTPEAFRARIEAARAVAPFTPYYTGLFPAEGWPRSLHELTPEAERTPWLLTSRLDNDDGLARDHMERLHAALAGVAAPERMALNFTEGFVLGRRRLYAHRHASNAFASWLEPFAPDALTAMGIRHMHFSDHGPVRQIGGPGAWLQVVHEENVSNRIRGRRVSPDAARERFPEGIAAELAPIDAVEAAFENALLTPLRDARDAAVGLARRILRRAGGRA